MLQWIKKAIIRIAWPQIKAYIITQINNEKYQELVVLKAEQKLPDTTGFSKKNQEKLLNAVYDACQEAAVEFINNIDVEKVIEKI